MVQIDKSKDNINILAESLVITSMRYYRPFFSYIYNTSTYLKALTFSVHVFQMIQNILHILMIALEP